MSFSSGRCIRAVKILFSTVFESKDRLMYEIISKRSKVVIPFLVFDFVAYHLALSNRKQLYSDVVYLVVALLD